MVIEALRAAPSPSVGLALTRAGDAVLGLGFTDSRIATCPSANRLGRAAGTGPACL